MPATSSTGRYALVYMAALALQFGMQPLLTKRFTPPSACRSSVVITQEVIKFVLALSMLKSSGQLGPALQGWSIKSWATVAVLPAGLYVVQNLCALVASLNLDPVSYNVLNQTKTLSAALCCYLILGRRQSGLQIVALLLLLLSALVLEKVVTINVLLSPFLGGAAGDEGEGTTGVDAREVGARHFTHGVTPLLAASFISGLAGAITQRNLQGSSGSGSKSGGKNAVLFSAELCIASLLLLCGALPFNEDGKCIAHNGMFGDWTAYTFIPIVTNALGGILVGLVTKYAGSVRKGFALIFGLMLSGLLQASIESRHDGSWAISKEEIIGGTLAAVSLWMHLTNPYKEPSKQKLN